MNSFVGLLRREWLESRTAFTWGPGAVLIVMLLAGVMAATVNPYVEAEMDSDDRLNYSEKLGAELDEDSSILEVIAAMAFDVAGSTDAELQNKMSKLLRGIVVPFHLIYLSIAFFTLLSCLYDERKDQSLLFWKSMPVSDAETVVSKLVFVVWLAPLVTIFAIIIAQFFAVSLSSLFVEEGMSGRIWSASQIWLRPFELLTTYFVMGIWALPLCGWVLCVSAWANRLPVLWALGVPWSISLLERIFLGSSEFGNMFVTHFKLLTSSPGSTEVVVFGRFDLLGEPRLWGGVVVGLLFVALAVYLRSRVNDAQ